MFSSGKHTANRKYGICPLAAYDGREPFADAFMALEDEHPYIRIIKSHCTSWSETDACIGEGELIAGIPRPNRMVSTSIWAGIQFDHAIYSNILETGDIKQKEHAQKIYDYFVNKHVTNDLIKKEIKKKDICIHESIGAGPGYQGHMVIDYAKMLAIGVPGIRAEITDLMSKCNDIGKEHFYRALLLLCNNISDMCLKYSKKALELKALAQSEERAGELGVIAEVCEAVSKRAPLTFREAIQLYWFTFLLDGNDDAGRIDQLLYPYYESDLAEGRITEESAKTMLADLWHKMSQTYAWGLVLGGVNSSGVDACNELTSICIEITKELHLINPAVSLRVSNNMPKKLWRSAMDCIATRGGMPALVNDEAVICAMLEDGIPVSDARDFALGGCIEYQVSGKSNFGGEDGDINLAKCLELALNNGICLITGKKIGLSTGDPQEFSCYEDVLDAYKRQAEWAVGRIIEGCNAGQKTKSVQGVKIFRSLLLDDCIQKGVDCEGGGARYGNGQILTNGIIVVTDSLAVIKYLVFEKRYISMTKLLEALKNNWQGFEALRTYIVNHAPHYGNHDDWVDRIAQDVALHFFSFLKNFKTFRGGHYTGLIVYFTRQRYYGGMTGATPDGRFSGEVLEDSMGPWPGRDRNGPTAMLHSVAAVPQMLAGGGVTLNLKLSQDSFNSEELIDKNIALVKTYFELGGQHIQISVADEEDLKMAMEQPEKWQHLIVRVGGYADYFTRLDRELQKSILMRTQYR